MKNQASLFFFPFARRVHFHAPQPQLICAVILFLHQSLLIVEYDSLTSEEQKAYKDKNWERVFDITPLDNHWIRRGSWVQATVWELRKEMIRRVRFFITGKYKHDP